jgi:hypothetical protein
MSEGSLPLILGTLLALAALSYVLLPLLSSSDEHSAPASRPEGGRTRARAVLPQEEGLAVSALREIEFDRETGKLSDSDYDELKSKYTQLALNEMRLADLAADAPAPAVSVAASAAGAGEDPVEAAVRAAQARRPKCPTCGPRPESDATYCSGCGHYLPGACGSCGAEVVLPGARFCNSCGVALAA